VAPTNPVLARVEDKLEALSKTATDDGVREDAAALIAFYGAHGDRPLWVADNALNDRAALAIAEIKKANDWGLDAAAFTLPEAAGPLTDETAADAEQKLSLAVLTYARDARGGRITDPSKQLSSYLDRMPQLLDPKAVIDQIAASATPDATLRGFHPKHPQFEKLRQKYLELLKGTEKAAEIVRMPRGPVLMPGQKHPDVALLRQRLNVPVAAAAAGAPAADPTLYDPALVTAVKAYQTDKGLAADGIVGGGTRTALNDIDTPNAEKIRANMEMWRWVPEDLGSYYVWVNLPEYLVRVIKDGAVVHEERIITGLVDKQTPVFSAAMELVTIHPRWNVPDSIKVRELYPSLARGGTYFQKQGLRMSQNGRPVDPYNIDWGSADIRRYDVYQPPGGPNVLGNVKFSFPNKHTVYMHDTPTKGLFNEAARPFSHGCMRVRDPQRLAEVLLGNDKGLTPQQVADLFNGPPVENPIQLDKKVPVHIVYFTEWIDDKGEEQRFKDVYGHEQRVMQALAGKWDQIVRGPDHLAPVTYAEGSRYASGGGNALDVFMNNLFGGF
jgi:murein L,D-transpeptidase YcbB/YkuD